MTTLLEVRHYVPKWAMKMLRERKVLWGVTLGSRLTIHGAWEGYRQAKRNEAWDVYLKKRKEC